MNVLSEKSSHFKTWKRLLSSKGQKEEKKFLLSGRKAVEDFFKTPLIREILYTKEHKKLAPQFFKNSLLKPYELRKYLFRQLDPFNTDFPLLIGEQPQIPVFDLKKDPKGLEVLCALGDPSNLGAFLRNCCAFYVSKVILLKESSWPFLPKSLKTSSGLALKAPLFQGPSLLTLKDNKHLTTLDPKGKNLYHKPLEKNIRLLIGEEGQGLPKLLRKKALKIPIHPQVESLNAMVAGSLFLFYYQTLHSENKK